MMNKTNLSKVVAEKTGLTQKAAASAVDAVIEAITETLVDGESVQIIGFGTFEVRDRAERVGKNPQTGDALLIPASKHPAFKAGKSLKDAVNA